jgi:hypothetical protein
VIGSWKARRGRSDPEVWSPWSSFPVEAADAATARSAAANGSFLVGTAVSSAARTVAGGARRGSRVGLPDPLCRIGRVVGRKGEVPERGRGRGDRLGDDADHCRETKGEEKV